MFGKIYVHYTYIWEKWTNTELQFVSEIGASLKFIT